MYKVLRLVIERPELIQERFKHNTDPDSHTAIQLTRLSPAELLRAILDNYLHVKHGYRVNNTINVPPTWVADFTSIDDMYDQISELYKSTVNVVPPTRQDFIVNKAPYTVAHPSLVNGRHPVVILRNPQISEGQITIDPNAELEFTIIY